MLARRHRLTTATHFSGTVRRGSRAGGPLVVVHLGLDQTDPTMRVGLVVSKAVGPAVVRNRVKRRLRHLVRERLTLLPHGSLVVRAQPAAATATYAELGAELDRCLERARAKASGPSAVVERETV